MCDEPAEITGTDPGSSPSRAAPRTLTDARQRPTKAPLSVPGAAQHCTGGHAAKGRRRAALWTSSLRRKCSILGTDKRIWPAVRSLCLMFDWWALRAGAGG